MQCIAEIIRLLDSCSERHLISTPESIFLDEINQLLTATPLLSLLEDVKESIFKARYETGTSLQHENKFIKISLYKNPRTLLQLRLHVWPKNEHVTSYHDHRWNFLSFLLKGTLVCHNWERRMSMDGKYQIFKLFDANDQLEKTAECIGQCDLYCSSSYRLSAGDYHFANGHHIHSTFTTTPSLSLMITGTPFIDYSHVIFLSEEREKARRVELNQNQILAVIDNLIASQQVLYG